jgi:hypothetical protein
MRKYLYRMRRDIVCDNYPNRDSKYTGWVIEVKRWWGWKEVVRSKTDLTHCFELLQTPMVYREISR